MSSLFTPITFSPSFVDFARLQGVKHGLLERVACMVDSYFDLTGRRLRVVKESSSGSGVFCLERFESVSRQEKALKVFSYMLLIPIIIMLLLKLILRVALYLKYGFLVCLDPESLKDLLVFQNEEYFFAPLSQEALRRVWVRHSELRSGLTKGELERRGIYFILDACAQDGAVLSKNPLIIFRLQEFPGLIFSSYPTDPSWGGGGRPLFGRKRRTKRRKRYSNIRNIENRSE